MIYFNINNCKLKHCSFLIKIKIRLDKASISTNRYEKKILQRTSHRLCRSNAGTVIRLGQYYGEPNLWDLQPSRLHLSDNWRGPLSGCPQLQNRLANWYHCALNPDQPQIKNRQERTVKSLNLTRYMLLKRFHFEQMIS